MEKTFEFRDFQGLLEDRSNELVRSGLLIIGDELFSFRWDEEDADKAYTTFMEIFSASIQMAFIYFLRSSTSSRHMIRTEIQDLCEKIAHEHKLLINPPDPNTPEQAETNWDFFNVQI